MKYLAKALVEMHLGIADLSTEQCLYRHGFINFNMKYGFDRLISAIRYIKCGPWLYFLSNKSVVEKLVDN